MLHNLRNSQLHQSHRSQHGTTQEDLSSKAPMRVARQFCPLGFRMQGFFDLYQNHDGRLGHFARGCVPAQLAREILLRRSSLVLRGLWPFFLETTVCLAFSASHKFFEWVGHGSRTRRGRHGLSGEGRQGDEWDTFLTFIGAVTSRIMFQAIPNRQLSNRR